MDRMWIAERLREIGRTKSQLGAALSLPPSRISEIISGRRQIQSHEISILALFLKLDIEVVVHRITPAEETHFSPPNVVTETVMISGEFCPKNNTYQLWSTGKQYAVILPKQANSERDSKLGLEYICQSSGAISLYICRNDHEDKGPQGTLAPQGQLGDLKILSEYRQISAR